MPVKWNSDPHLSSAHRLVECCLRASLSHRSQSDEAKGRSSEASEGLRRLRGLRTLGVPESLHCLSLFLRRVEEFSVPPEFWSREHAFGARQRSMTPSSSFKRTERYCPVRSQSPMIHLPKSRGLSYTQTASGPPGPHSVLTLPCAAVPSVA